MTKHSTIISDIKLKVHFDELFKELYQGCYRETGNSLCPFHEDSSPSFQVEKEHGYCHAGCKPHSGNSPRWSVIDLWMEAKGVDFKTALNELAERYGIRNRDKPKDKHNVVKTYSYEDESGKLLYEVCRLDPKGDFPLRRPNGNGGWIYNLGNTRRILYRLPQVIESETAWVCEGEKDADNVSALRLCGTTAPLGAGKWKGLVDKHDIHEPLKGKVVFVIPDNDEAGRKHALEIARTLHGFAASVKILNLPGLPHKGDVSNLIEKHGPEEAKALLTKLAETTPEYEPSAQTQASESGPHLTDMGNCERLAALVRDKIRFCQSLGGCLQFDGIRWALDQTSRLQAAAKQAVMGIYDEAATTADPDRQEAMTKFARKCESAARINAMIQLLPSEPGMSLLQEVFDRDPMLLNIRNGTLNLSTGELQPHNPDNLITKYAPVDYDPDATCPRWEQFISEITDDDQELAAYIQRVVGYSLTGKTIEQAWFFLWGKGSNGKSVFINAVSEIMGDYAVDTPASSFMETRRNDAPRNDLAMLRGARFVTASEPDNTKDRGRIDAATLKKISGDGKITARFLNHEFFEYTPEAKVFLCANKRPEVSDSSDAFWRRIQLIPFNRQFKDQECDKDLPEKLRAEASGIFNWMVKGCRSWQEVGLNPPDTVKLAIDDYRNDADALGNFLEENCVVTLSAIVPVGRFYKEYQAYCRANEQHPLSAQRFNENLLGRPGISKGKSGPKNARVKVWRGIGMKAEGEGANIVSGTFRRAQRSCDLCNIPPLACPISTERRDAASCQYYQAQGA